MPSLRVLAHRTDLSGVVTQPDRPAGRGHKLQPTPVKTAANELGLRVYEPRSLRDFGEQLSREAFDLFALASYGKILPKRILDLPRLGALNVHPSLLPKYRGATPLQSALREGANETGVTIMLMDAGMDTGDVVLQERTPVRPGETYGELHDRLANFGAQALSHAIDLARSGHIPRVPQTGEASVTKPVTKDDLRLDWNDSASQIVNTVRAFSPQPAARADVNGISVKILNARVAPLETLEPPGSVIGVDGDALVVAARKGAVALTRVVPPNKGEQSGATFAQSLGVRS
ncbi:MAG: methionyl-tRNA formyltransferase [Candidatus Eremiobacteraeota bacterium]|nr:methionyl-tRNA formyltransferase [Candidatus Eremiobacteraeota bacterium]